MNRAKFIITVLLIMAFLIVIVLTAFGIVLSMYFEVLHSTHGMVPIAAFIVAAIIVGYTLEKIIERIKRLWQ